MVAVQDVRAKGDTAKPDLPGDADEPGVFEVNLSLFPIVTVTTTLTVPLPCKLCGTATLI